MRTAFPIGILLLAFALRARIPRAGSLGFDGGLAVALASSSPDVLLDLAARDVHPPLYYLLLAAWLKLAGPGIYPALWPSLALGVLAVAAATRLGGRAGLVSAALLAVAPLHVVDGMAARDFAVLVPLTLITTALLVKRQYGALPLLYAAGLLSSYYFVLTLAAHLALLLWRRAPLWPWLRTTAPGSLAITAWAALSLTRIGPALVDGARATESDPPGLGEVLSGLIQSAVGGPALPAGAAAAGAWAVLAAWGAAVALLPSVRGRNGPPDPLPRPLVDRWLVAVVGFELALAGTAAVVLLWLRDVPPGRYALVLLPWIVLLAGLGFDTLLTRAWSSSARAAIAANSPDGRAAGAPPGRPPLANGTSPHHRSQARPTRVARLRPVIVLLLLASLALLPPVTGLALAWRPSELPRAFFDPRGLAARLDTIITPGDAVLFISLEQAGYYAALSQTPRTTTVIPIGPRYLEGDLPTEAARKLNSQQNDRIHLVLYQGGITPRHAILKQHLHDVAYPAAEQELADSRVLTYVTASGPTRELLPRPQGFPSATLKSAVFEGQAGLTLTWQAHGPLDKDYSVFVHLLDATGNKIAQHDGAPAGGARPTHTWRPGEVIRDRHGLQMAPGATAKAVLIGLYGPDGRRLATEEGPDAIRLSL